MSQVIDHTDIVNACKRSFARGDCFEVASRYNELLDGHHLGLISNQWKSDLEGLPIQIFLSNNLEAIKQEWIWTFEQLARIIRSGQRVCYEEMMQILTLRSELEWCKKYVGEDDRTRLNVIDEDLLSFLRSNRTPHGQCGGIMKKQICQNHWWWKSVEPE